MPQLNPEVFIPQIAWLAVLFGVLYVAMARFALPRIARVLAERRGRIDADLEGAGALRAETTALIAAHDAAMHQARATAHDELGRLAQRLAAEAAQRQGVLAEKLAGQIREAESRIAADRRQALANVAELAAGIVGAGLSRLGVTADPASVRRAINGAAR